MTGVEDWSGVPQYWIESLERSIAQVETGETIALWPVLEELYAVADQLEADLAASRERGG